MVKQAVRPRHTHPVMDYVSIDNRSVQFYPRSWVIRTSGMDDLYQPDSLVINYGRIVVQSTVVR